MTAPHFLTTKTHVPLSPSGLLDRLAAAMDRLGNRVHAESDESARGQGWQITRTRWGGRTYRHPGFPRHAAPAPRDEVPR